MDLASRSRTCQTATRPAKLIIQASSPPRPKGQIAPSRRWYLLDSSGGYLLDDRGSRLLAQWWSTRTSAQYRINGSSSSFLALSAPSTRSSARSDGVVAQASRFLAGSKRLVMING